VGKGWRRWKKKKVVLDNGGASSRASSC
jgi:hypothetical protein